MFFVSPWILIPLLILDSLLGDPPNWPHLVRFVGASISGLERFLRARFSASKNLRPAGVILCLAVVGGWSLAAWSALALAHLLWPPLAAVLGAIVSYQCLAAGQLSKEALAAAEPLTRGDLDLARQRLAMIVGRETANLDEAQVQRAIIETVAENLNDGVVAPLFYLALAGPAGAVAYKAVNTLDSMVGYRNEKYEQLGWFSARVDDVAGWAPARITALLMLAVCPFFGLDAGQARKTLLRDKKAHKSPNAGWPEAACAGALGLRLGGPNRYHGSLVEKPWLNQGGRDPVRADVKAALRLMWGVTASMGLAAVLWSVLFH